MNDQRISRDHGWPWLTQRVFVRAGWYVGWGSVEHISFRDLRKFSGQLEGGPGQSGITGLADVLYSVLIFGPVRDRPGSTLGPFWALRGPSSIVTNSTQN